MGEESRPSSLSFPLVPLTKYTAYSRRPLDRLEPLPRATDSLYAYSLITDLSRIPHRLHRELPVPHTIIILTSYLSSPIISSCNAALALIEAKADNLQNKTRSHGEVREVPEPAADVWKTNVKEELPHAA